MKTNLPQNWQVPAATFCLSTLLSLLSISLSLSSRDRPGWLTVVIILLGVAAVVLALDTLRRGIHLIGASPLGTRLGPRVHVGVHAPRWAASENDVVAAHEFLRRLLKDEAPDLPLMLALYRHNPRCIRLIDCRKGTGSAELVGLVIVAPLTAQGARAFDEGRIRRIADAEVVKHVTKTWRRPHAVYIGGVAGSTHAGRAWALSSLEALVEQSGARKVYARPASKDGERVMRGAGFAPIPQNAAFWRLQLP